jgi:hypothetical protein
MYDVVTSKRIHSDGTEYEARLIIYTTPALATWKLLMVNPFHCTSSVDAMTDLLEALYERGHSGRGTLYEMNREKRRKSEVTGEMCWMSAV